MATYVEQVLTGALHYLLMNNTSHKPNSLDLRLLFCMVLPTRSLLELAVSLVASVDLSLSTDSLFSTKKGQSGVTEGHRDSLGQFETWWPRLLHLSQITNFGALKCPHKMAASISSSCTSVTAALYITNQLTMLLQSLSFLW